MIVLTSRHTRIIQQRQSLYQAILHLEKKGLTVLDRDIAEDISLSADTCLLILTERATQVCSVASDVHLWDMQKWPSRMLA